MPAEGSTRRKRASFPSVFSLPMLAGTKDGNTENLRSKVDANGEQAGEHQEHAGGDASEDASGDENEAPAGTKRRADRMGKAEDASRTVLAEIPRADAEGGREEDGAETREGGGEGEGMQRESERVTEVLREREEEHRKVVEELNDRVEGLKGQLSKAQVRRTDGVEESRVRERDRDRVRDREADR